MAATSESFGGCAVVISHDRWFEGNYSDYEKDRHTRLGAAADQPHRIRYRHLTRE